MSYLVGLDLNDVAAETFNGNGSTVAFTLATAAVLNSTSVYIHGVRQTPTTDYTISGTTLTFSTAPVSATANVLVVYAKPAIVNTPADDSVTTAKVANDAITGAKLNPAFVSGDIVYADGTDTITRLAKPGTPAGEVLTFATSASAPSWVAAAGGGKVLQVVDANNATLTSSSATYPDDNTIPQVSEMTEIETVAITPAHTNNALWIRGFYHGSITSSNSYSICIFKDSDTDALAISTLSSPNVSGQNWQVEYYISGSVGTSEIVYKMHIGRQTGGSGNTTANTYDAGGAAKMGGIYRCRMLAMEISA